MASDVEVANAALAKLGEPGLLSFADDSVAGRLASRTFADIRDTLLREYPWNFATKRASLAAEVATPLWGFARQYPVPPDFLRLLEMENPNKWDYNIEGGKILTDLTPPLNIRYIRRVEAVDEMDLNFREALAARLAAEWAESLTQTTTVTEQMNALYTQKLRIARAADGQEDDHRALETTSFIDARW